MKLTIYGADGKLFAFSQPAVMAILNATPDSFSDGGEIATLPELQKRVRQIIDEGADIIDIGGESTRPGHDPVSVSDEIDRIVPAIHAVKAVNANIPISIDTRKAIVAKAALAAGADFVNDVSGLTDIDMAEIIASNGCSVVVMRHQALGPDVVATCQAQKIALVKQAQKRGIKTGQIIFDPGLGFGDLTAEDFTSLPGGNVTANLELAYSILDYAQELPVLIGASRKRFVGELSGQSDVKNRLAGSLAVAYMALRAGAAIIRAHDISQTVQVRDIVMSNK